MDREYGRKPFYQYWFWRILCVVYFPLSFLVFCDSALFSQSTLESLKPVMAVGIWLYVIVPSNLLGYQFSFSMFGSMRRDGVPHKSILIAPSLGYHRYCSTMDIYNSGVLIKTTFISMVFIYKDELKFVEEGIGKYPLLHHVSPQCRSPINIESNTARLIGKHLGVPLPWKSRCNQTGSAEEVGESEIVSAAKAVVGLAKDKPGGRKFVMEYLKPSVNLTILVGLAVFSVFNMFARLEKTRHGVMGAVSACLLALWVILWSSGILYSKRFENRVVSRNGNLPRHARVQLVILSAIASLIGFISLL